MLLRFVSCLLYIENRNSLRVVNKVLLGYKDPLIKRPQHALNKPIDKVLLVLG